MKDFHHKSVATNMETLRGAGGLGPLQRSQPFRGSFNFADLSRNSSPNLPIPQSGILDGPSSV